MPRNTLRLDTSGISEMIEKLAELEGDVQKAVADALTQAAETIHDDTVDALSRAHLPARGRYSSGDTLASVVDRAPVEWEGTVASVPVGFDFSKPGAGGFLIKGTPRMKPDAALHRIYVQKKYMNKIQNDMADVVMDYIAQEMER